MAQSENPVDSSILLGVLGPLGPVRPLRCRASRCCFDRWLFALPAATVLIVFIFLGPLRSLGPLRPLRGWASRVVLAVASAVGALVRNHQATIRFTSPQKKDTPQGVLIRGPLLV